MNNGPDWCQKDMKKKKEIKSLLCGNESGFLRRFDAFTLKSQTSKKKKKQQTFKVAQMQWYKVCQMASRTPWTSGKVTVVSNGRRRVLLIPARRTSGANGSSDCLRHQWLVVVSYFCCVPALEPLLWDKKINQKKKRSTFFLTEKKKMQWLQYKGKKNN